MLKKEVNDNKAAKLLKEICKVTRSRLNYEPSTRQVNKIINDLCETDNVNITPNIYQPLSYYNLNLKWDSNNNLKILFANSLLGFLLLFYRPEFDKSIARLLEKKQQLTNQDILILIAIADKINKPILELLLKSHCEELPSKSEPSELLSFLALQSFINETLIDFLLSKLNPTIDYDKKNPGVTGITIAKEKRNYALLNYYHQKGFKIDVVHHSELEHKNHSSNPTITGFEEEVDQFTVAHDIKSLETWLSEKGTSPIAYNYALFLSNPIIGNFLSREDIKTENDIPHYHKYENSFYLGLRTLFKIPYRSDGSSLSLAESKSDTTGQYRNGSYPRKHYGSTYETADFIYKKLKQELVPNDRFILVHPQDTYDLSERLEVYKKIQSDNRFIYVFGLTGKDSHVLSTLSCLDTNTETVLFHIIINSWENPGYVKEISRSINSESINKQSIIPDIFDASFPVQINENDIYCTSYSVEITRALYVGMSDSSFFSEMEKFAENNDRKDQWDAFKNKIQTEIKNHLPMFFDHTADGLTLKSKSDIIKWHIHNRIKYGAKFIGELQAEATKMVNDNSYYFKKLA